MLVKSVFAISFCRAYVKFDSVVWCNNTSLINNVSLATFIFDWVVGFCSAVTQTYHSFIFMSDLFIMTVNEGGNVRSTVAGYLYIHFVE